MPNAAVELGVLVPHLAGAVVEGVASAAGLLLLLAWARADAAACPSCGAAAARVHSRYARGLAERLSGDL